MLLGLEAPAQRLARGGRGVGRGPGCRGGARGPGAGPRRGAGSGGPSVTHAAAREAAAATALGAAGTGTGARARAGACCLGLSLALPPAEGPRSAQHLRKGRAGAEDAKFVEQPQVLAEAEAAAPTGQAGARSAAGRTAGVRGLGRSGPALSALAGWDPMRRAREGRETLSPGGARRKRRAALQLGGSESGRQEAAKART